MESRAGGLVRLPGSVGARPEGHVWCRLAGRLVGAWVALCHVPENV